MKHSARLVKFQSIVEIGTLHITASASKISQWQNGKHKPLIIVVTLWSEQFNVRVASHWFVNSRPSCCIECLIHTSTHCTFMFQFSNAYFFYKLISAKILPNIKGNFGNLQYFCFPGVPAFCLNSLDQEEMAQMSNNQLLSKNEHGPVLSVGTFST